MRPEKQKGASMVETLIVLPLIVGALTLGLKPLSLATARLWLEHTLYSTLKCELQSATSCREKAKKMSDHLPWGKVRSLHWQITYDQKMYKRISGELIWCNLKSVATCGRKNSLHLKMQIQEKTIAALR